MKRRGAARAGCVAPSAGTQDVALCVEPQESP